MGPRLREVRADGIATGWTYDTLGNQTAEIRNYDNGDVALGGLDITPDTSLPTSLNARTDLTTIYGYDTAGNRTSSADPRRAIEAAKGTTLGADDFVSRSTFDALGQLLSDRTPTTPGVSITQKTATTAYDELGNVREATDFGGLVTGTEFDRAGRANMTYEDTASGNPDITSDPTLDAAGRVTSAKDRRQVDDASLGATATAYDELGRTISITEAKDSAPSTTVTVYNALDQRVLETTGTESVDAQTTRWTYDAAGRVLDENDGFTCSTSTYGWRDQANSIVEGRTAGSPCSGSGARTITQAFDALGRLTSRAVQGGAVLEANTYDSAGQVLTTLASDDTTDRVTETTWNPLDEPITEHRFSRPTGGGTPTGETWSRANRDPAGNETDRCTWAAAPAEWCHKADDATWAAPVPTTRVSARFDARNSRIQQFTPGLGATTYDPDAGYQVKGVFLPTANGLEHQTLYAYDAQDRLDTITVQLCSAAADPCPSIVPGSQRVLDDYGYDANDNRTSVAENNGSGAVTTTYGYDGRNQLIADSSGGIACPGGQGYAYDAAGNRTCAFGRTFGYVNGTGQLESCTGIACLPVFDADGRLTRITTATGTWSYLYDGEGRLTSVCAAASCTGAGFGRLDSVYDGEGHRTRLVETPASGTPTVTDFTYEGDKVVREVATTGAQVRTRTFTVDEAGAIVKMAVATTGGSITDDGTYLVLWNGHGDAVELSRIDPGTGALAPANRFTYSTWGKPTLQTVGTFGDLGFRYRYVGRFDVQWDSTTAVPAELLYMHARHYAPEFGRFQQPDPSAAEANLYAYAGDSPIVKVDPSGSFAIILVIAFVSSISLLEVAGYAAVAAIGAGGGILIGHYLVGRNGKPQWLPRSARSTDPNCAMHVLGCAQAVRRGPKPVAWREVQVKYPLHWPDMSYDFGDRTPPGPGPSRTVCERFGFGKVRCRVFKGLTFLGIVTFVGNAAMGVGVSEPEHERVGGH